MPTVDLTVDGDGTHTGWSAVVGVADAWDAVNDSTTTTHDSDATYFWLPKLVLGTGAGRGSFTMPWHLHRFANPSSLMLNVVAKRHEAGSASKIEIGFAHADSVGFHGTKGTLTANYQTLQRTFTTNPITGLAWATNDFPLLEACVQTVTGFVYKARVTLISCEVTWAEDVSIMHNPGPRAFPTS